MLWLLSPLSLFLLRGLRLSLLGALLFGLLRLSLLRALLLGWLWLSLLGPLLLGLLRPLSGFSLLWLCMLCRRLVRLCLRALLLCRPRSLLWLTLLFLLLVLRVHRDNRTVKQNHGSGADSSKEFHTDCLQ